MALKVGGTTVVDDSRQLNNVTGIDATTKTTLETALTNINANTLDGQDGSYYTGYTDTAIANLVASAPTTLDTLNELAAALGDDPNFATTVTNNIATKAASSITISAGGGLTGGGNLTANRTISHADTSSQASVNNSNGVVIQDVTLDGYGHVTALGSIDLDGRYYTETEADSRFVNVTGDTMTGTLNVPSIYADRYFQDATGVPTNNLGGPTVTEMALFDAQFTNKTAFHPTTHVFFETSTDNINWTDFPVSDTVKKRFVGGDRSSGIVGIPYGTPYFRVRFKAVSYVFLNALYSYWSSNGHNTQVHVYKRLQGTGVWSAQHTSSTAVSSWPGHLYLPFNTIPFNPSNANQYDEVAFVFIPSWNSSYPSNAINLYNCQVWGGYPSGRRNTFSVDEDKNHFFPSEIYANESNLVFHDNYHPNADKLTTARNIALTGDVTGSANFDGSANISITATVANDSHTHDGRYYTESEADSRFVNTSGDTMSGDLIISKADAKARLYDSTGTSGNNPFIEFDTTANQGIAIELNVYDGELPTAGYGLVVGPSTTNSQFPTTGTLTFNVLGEIYAGGTTLGSLNKVFHDAYHPNADKLTTARNIALTGAVTGNANFDGSGNISIATTHTADPTLTINGDASGSATFTNLGNATLTLTIADDSHNHIISNVDGLQTALDGKASTNHTHTLLTANPNYIWSASTNGRDFNLGIESSFVRSADGYPDYGSVVRVATYDNDGSTAELYFPYSATYGGSAMRYRLGQYNQAGWTSWKTVIDDTNIGSYAWTSSNDGSGSGLDADLLDGLNSTSFIRSDANDTGTGGYSTSGTYWEVGNGTGSVAINTNDGYGNANLTFNHNGGVPDITGNAARIEVNVDSTSGANMNFEVKSGVTAGTAVQTTSILNLSESQVTAYKTLYENSNRVFTDGYHPNADKWTTARTLSLTGAVTGSVSIDGSGNVSLATTATSDPTLTINGDASGSATFTNLGNATLTLTVADDSHNHVWGNIDGASIGGLAGPRFTTASGYIEFGPANTTWAHIYTDRPNFYFNKDLYVLGSKVWHAGNDGAGSGLDADLLDGQHGSYYYSPANPPPAAGATGGGSDQIFYENDQTVTTNYTITSGKNAMSAGPITINAGVTVTVGEGQTWKVV